MRAWTIKNGMTAPQAAGVIHSDFERGFIKAEVYNCEDLFRLGIGSPNVVDAAVLTMAVNDQTIRSSRIMKQMGGRTFHDQTDKIWRS